jgi:hypothetical protein
MLLQGVSPPENKRLEGELEWRQVTAEEWPVSLVITREDYPEYIDIWPFV